MTDQADRAMQEAEELLHSLWDEKYDQFLNDEQRAANKCETEGDMYGYNFHEGMRHGAVHMDLDLRLLSKSVAAKLRDKNDTIHRMHDKMDGWQEEIEELKKQLATANAETDMWAKRCNDALFQRDQLSAQLAVRDNQITQLLATNDQHVIGIEELRAEVERLKAK